VIQDIFSFSVFVCLFVCLGFWSFQPTMALQIHYHNWDIPRSGEISWCIDRGPYICGYPSEKILVLSCLLLQSGRDLMVGTV